MCAVFCPQKSWLMLLKRSINFSALTVTDIDRYYLILQKKILMQLNYLLSNYNENVRFFRKYLYKFIYSHILFCSEMKKWAKLIFIIFKSKQKCWLCFGFVENMEETPYGKAGYLFYQNYRRLCQHFTIYKNWLWICWPTLYQNVFYDSCFIVWITRMNWN